MLDKGCVDYDHAACAFMGARAKKQRWRGNIEHIRKRRAECRHVHSKNEWQWERDKTGKSMPKTKEEAEYTAHHAFYIAVELSVWAVETGRATLSLPKFRLLPSESGSRVGWTEYPPAAFRSWAMPGYGLRLQLSPPSIPSLKYDLLPTIRNIAEAPRPLPPGWQYVGAGNALHKLPAYPLYSAYCQTTAVEPEARLIEFSVNVEADIDGVAAAIDSLAQAVPEVKVLVVDEQAGEPSLAEVIARRMWACRKTEKNRNRQRPGTFKNTG